MINQHKEIDGKEFGVLINNWRYGEDAYKDSCACFEHGNLYAEIRVRPDRNGWSCYILVEDTLNDRRRRKKLNSFEYSKEKARELVLNAVNKKSPEEYLKYFEI